MLAVIPVMLVAFVIKTVERGAPPTPERSDNSQIGG